MNSGKSRPLTRTEGIVRICALTLAVLMLLGLIVYTAHLSPATEALSQVGSRGNEVREIQQRLKQWAYYLGEVDGVYGTQTKKAVVAFQRKNGLSADGIAGPDTLRAMGITPSQQEGGGGGLSQGDIAMLANIISAEARGESYEGQVAVGAVVLNRVAHPSFPDTLAGVIYQPGAFTAITDGQIDQPISDSAYRAARDAINGWDPSGGAIYYYNPDKTSNQWIRTRPVIKRIGSHLFCR